MGIIQVRALDQDFTSAEWGFALGSPFWGTGLFIESARAVVDFALDVLGVHRLEARAAVSNPRGNGVLRKLRAEPEGVLRQAFHRNGQHVDQVLWTIISTEWRQQAKAVWGNRIH